MAVAYTVVYAWLLGATRGLPYVLDNNESFSAALFASNLLSFPIWKSLGLADEALGPSAAAHPVVYTHGGNFPRLFIVLLDLVGVRSVEWQIGIATFTVGALAVLLVYLFFEAAADSLFAAIACLLLLSDYVLFAQWQVNTWRVWQGLFLFAALVCVQRLTRPQARWWLVAVGLGAGLFYLELVFGAFVVILTVLYAAWLYRRRLRLAVGWAACFGGGAGLALVLLTAQRIGYLGWDGMLADTFLTYSARVGDSGTDALDRLRAFYNAHHVAFWYNLVDPRAFSSVSAFARGVFHYTFEVWTPLLALVALIVLAGGLAGRLSLARAQPAGRGVPAAVAAASLFTAWLLLLLVAFSGHLVLGLPPTGRWRFLVWDGSLVSLALAVVGAAVASATLARLATGRWLRFAPLAADRLAISVGLLVLVAVFARFQYRLYDESDQALWLQALAGSAWVGQAAVAVAALLAGATSLLGLPSGRLTHLRDAFAYVVCGFLAYGIIYGLAAGYVMTGYVTRYAPLLVFVVDALLALAVYVALRLALDWLRAVRGARRSAGFALASLVSLFLAVYWVRVQVAYAQALPPTLFGFLPMLAQPPYAGASFVVNNYAAPAATFTGQWAYHDPLFGNGASTAGYIVSRDTVSYLWEADRDTNPAYLKPDYFLCVLPETLSSVASELRRPDLPVERCSVLPLVYDAERGGGFPHTLVARDESGHDAWAIVRLDPNFELAPGEHGPPTPAGDVALGDHWYPFEAYLGETFRWASNDAEVTVTAPTGSPRPLLLEIEPGPGVGYQAMSLQVLDRQGGVAAVVPVAPGRQVARVRLPLPPGATATYRLHVDGGGQPTPNDPRTLNFRVFSYGWDRAE